MVASQPRTIPQVTVEQPRPKTKPAMLIFTVVLSILCGIHLCIPAFVCLTPALVFAIVVSGKTAIVVMNASYNPHTFPHKEDRTGWGIELLPSVHSEALSVVY